MTKKKKKPDFLRKPMKIEVDSIAGVTPKELINEEFKPLLEKRDETEQIIEEVFNIKKSKLRVVLNNIKTIIKFKLQNLVSSLGFVNIDNLKNMLEIPVFIIFHGLLGYSILFTFFNFAFTKLAIVHIIACGSIYYFLYDTIKLLCGRLGK